MAYLKENVFSNLSGPTPVPRQAQVVVEVDCDITGGVYDCGSIGGTFVAELGTIYSAFMGDIHISGDVTILALNGFAERAATGFGFGVNAAGCAAQYGAADPDTAAGGGCNWCWEVWRRWR